MTGRLKRTGSGARNLASTGFTVGGLLKNAYTMTLLLFQPLKDAWARRCATPTRCWRRAPCAVDRLRYTRRKSLSLAECPDASHSPGPDTRSQRSLEPSIAQRPPPGRAPPPSTLYHGLAHAVSRNSYFRCVLSYRCIRQALHPRIPLPRARFRGWAPNGGLVCTCIWLLPGSFLLACSGLPVRGSAAGKSPFVRCWPLRCARPRER